MKRLLNLLFALLLPAALCLPVFAEGEEAAPKEAAAQPEKKAAAKPAPKKKAKKKKKAEPVSEYKFQAVEKTETYKFDRKANPIVKEKKKPAKKKAPAKKAAPAPSSADTENATGAAPVTE